MTKTDLIEKIRGSALLVSLSLGSYNPVKLDRSASATVAAENGCSSKVARVTKNTLPTANVLEAITKLDTRIRATVEQHTAPFARGVGLLPASKFFDLRNIVSALFDDRNALVNQLAVDYAIYLDQAKRELGGLFNPTDYPDVASVVARFSTKLDVMPIGSPQDARLNVMGELAESIQSAMSDTLTEKLESVAPYVRELLLKPLLHMSAVLQNPEHSLYESLFVNVLEAADQAEHLNLLEDPQIANAVYGVRDYFTNVTKEEVKSSDHVRARVLADCNRLLESLDAEIPAPAKSTGRKGKAKAKPAIDGEVTPPSCPEPDNSTPVEDNSEADEPATPNADAILAKLGW